MADRRYVTAQDGEWFRPTPQNHKMACCDCGLVHTVNFRIRDGHVELQAFRNRRSTAQVRRHRTHRFEWRR